jgi:uncharacterized protein (TIGR02147 family)
MKSLFSYLNYRIYLSDFYEEKKSTSDYSYRRFSQKAGLGSPNYLALVIDQKRDLTIANIHQFAAALDLRTDEVEYFETLVLLNQASTPEEKRYYEDRRQKLVRTKPKVASKKTPSEALREWYYTAVMVLAHDRTLEEAIQKACRELGLKAAEVQKTIEDLSSLGLLAENGTRKLQISANQITFNDPKGLSQAQEKFLSSQLRQSFKAFQQTYKDKTGKFISHTLTIPAGAIEKIHHQLISLVEKMTEEMDAQVQGSNAEVAQINVQIFRPRNWK